MLELEEYCIRIALNLQGTLTKVLKRKTPKNISSTDISDKTHTLIQQFLLTIQSSFTVYTSIARNYNFPPFAVFAVFAIEIMERIFFSCHYEQKRLKADMDFECVQKNL